MDDAFDARLRAAFRAAEPRADGESFAADVSVRLARAAAKRRLIVGGAGVAGALVAATQIPRLAAAFQPLDGVVSRLSDEAALLSYSSPDTVAAAVAVLALVVVTSAYALILPSRS